MATRRSPKEKPTFKWRVPVKCDDCPFHDQGPGRHLRDSLGDSRWVEIVASLYKGAKFDCHNTTQATGHDANLYCAGALEFQRERGINMDYINLCESFEQSKVRETKEELFQRLQKIVRVGTRRKSTTGSRTRR